MAKWRIKEVTHYPGTKNESKRYFVEKRFLGFLWWYDPFEDGLYSDGECATYEEALKIINKELTYKKNTKIVWTDEQ